MRKNLFKRITKLFTAGILAVTMVTSMGMSTSAGSYKSFSVYKGRYNYECVTGARLNVKSNNCYVNITIVGIGTTLCFFDGRGNCVWSHYYGAGIPIQSFYVGRNVKRISARTTGWTNTMSVKSASGNWVNIY